MTRKKIEEIRKALATLNNFLNELEEFEDIPVNKGRPKPSKDVKIINLLREIGVPVHIDGYHYLKEAIMIFLENKSSQKIYMTKEVYPKIAKKFDSTSSGVEHAIRHAIDVAWTKGDKDAWKKIVGYKQRKRPVNHECIALLADYLKRK